MRFYWSFKYTQQTTCSYLFALSHSIWQGDWDFIFSVIRKFGYRNKFIHMIQVAYINIQSKTKIDGLLFDSFILIQGFYQGSPPSMSLCTIAAEVLAIFIDADARIKGIQIGDHEIKIVNFADDTWWSDFSCPTKIELILKLKSF